MSVYIVFAIIFFVIGFGAIELINKKMSRQDDFLADNSFDDKIFDENLTVLHEMVDREGGIDVWDFFDNMCLVEVSDVKRKQINDFLAILEPKDQQEVISFFDPFDSPIDSIENSCDVDNALESGDKEPMERFSKILGKLARTPEWQVLKSDPNWQELRDIINEDRRESNQKEL
jgi:hypothetical protein